MNKSNLIRILEGDIELIDKVEDTGILNIEISIYPNHVKNILLRYLDNELNENQIKKWAAFICIHPEYCVPDYNNDLTSDYYETMYYVIQRVSTPELDGAINKTLINSYLLELAKYFEPGS